MPFKLSYINLGISIPLKITKTMKHSPISETLAALGVQEKTAGAATEQEWMETWGAGKLYSDSPVDGKRIASVYPATSSDTRWRHCRPLEMLTHCRVCCAIESACALPSGVIRGFETISNFTPASPLGESPR